MVGSCFYYDTFPKGQHLFVVLAPCPEQQDWYVCVNITTKRVGSDLTCEILKGEHPNLSSPVSVVVYSEARESPARLIDRQKKQQQIPDVSAALLLKIQKSPLTEDSRLKKKYKRYIEEYLRLQR
jgi:hypothetical protein